MKIGQVVLANAIADTHGNELKVDLKMADDAERGAPTNRDGVGEFELRAGATIVASGGIGANFDLVRKHWPERMGRPPAAGAMAWIIRL